MVAVYRTLNLADAELVRSRLEAAGFHAAVMDAIAALTTAGYSQATGGIRVEVPDSEAEEVREFLAAPGSSAA